MASMIGWPTDGDDGSVATEARWRSMARLWAPSGVVAGYLGELAPTLAAGPIINVAAGAAWVDGHYTELGSAASESATANGLLVVRFTAASNLFELVYRDGATTPTQTDAVWELPVAQMTGGALTDLRVFTNQMVRVATVPVTLTIPSTVSLVTISGRLYAGGTAQTITEVLGARFNGVGTASYSRVLESVSNTSAFARDFLSNANFARLGPVPTNTNSNMFLRSVFDARNCSWTSEGFASRTTTVYAQDRVMGSFQGVNRLTTLELLLSPAALGAAGVDLTVMFQ